MLPLQILHARTPYVPPGEAASPSSPPPSALAPSVLNASLNWVAAEVGLGASNISLPDFNWTGVNFTTGGAPVGYMDSQRMTQPVSSAGLAWLHYVTRAAGQAGALSCPAEPCQAELLQVRAAALCVQAGAVQLGSPWRAGRTLGPGLPHDRRPLTTPSGR